MTYSVGGLIQAADYNTFQTNLNTVWSTGSTDSGWGQTALSAVSANGVVAATNWASLVNTLATAGSQTNTTLTSRTAPVTGNVIAILANVATDITSVTTRRGYAPDIGPISETWTGSISKTTQTGSGAGAWVTSWAQTVTFPSAAQARYFWNAGGLVRLDMNKTSTGNDLDVEWNNFVATVGTLYISGRVNNANQVIAGTTYTGFTRIGGSGTPSPNLTTTGWYQLTSSPANLFFLTSSVAPSDSYIALYASASVGTQLLLTTVWFQGDRGPGVGTTISGGTATTSPFSYGAFGTAPTVLCRFVPPATTQGLANTWGTPIVNSTLT